MIDNDMVDVSADSAAAVVFSLFLLYTKVTVMEQAEKSNWFLEG